MPSEAFIQAMKRPDRQPVMLMAVESINAVTVRCTTQSDWQSYKSVTGSIDLTSVPGSVKLILSQDIYTSTNVDTIDDFGYTTPSTLNFSTAYAGYLTRLVITFGNDQQQGFLGHFEIWQGGSKLYQSNSYGITNGVTLTFNFYVAIAAGAYTVLFYSNVPGLTAWIMGPASGYALPKMVYSVGVGTIQTKTLDLGLTPTQDTVFQSDDLNPSGCSITYTARGSNTAATGPWTNLGAVIDGSTIGQYRWYDFTATLTPNVSTPSSPTLQEIRIVGGNSAYEYYSTHYNLPIQDALPYLVKGGVQALSSKIELDQRAATGETSVKLHFNQQVSNLVATGRLKNKAVIIKIGEVTLAESEYEPYFTGKIYDWNLNDKCTEISLKIRDVWQQFNSKIPPETVDGSGNKTTTALVFSAVNIIDAALTIADQLSVPDRYLDRASFTAVKNASRTGSNWTVTRTISSPASADDLLSELQVSSGCFFVPGADGKLRCVLYDPAATPVDTLDADVVSFGAVEGGQKELFTRQVVYYSLISGKTGNSKEDYSKAVILINAQAESDWGEKKEKEWLDKWALSAYARNDSSNGLTYRWDNWYANPKMTVKASGVPPRQWGIDRGQKVAVNGLKVPAPMDEWSGSATYALGVVLRHSGRIYRSLQAANANKNPDAEPTWWQDTKIHLVGNSWVTDNKPFLVMSRNLDPNKLSLSFDLLEV